LATLLAISKIITIVAILSPSTTVNTIHPVAHHNAKST
jgi:hypothetical protein